MRIVFVTPEFVTEDYFSGGLANYVHRASQSLAKRGHNVHVFVKSDREETITIENVFIHRVLPPSKSSILFKLTKKFFEKLLVEPYMQIGFSFKIFRELKLLNTIHPIDIIQFPNSQACGLIPCLFLRNPKVLRISCYRPEWNRLAGIPRKQSVKLCEWLEVVQLKLSRNVFTPSRLLKEMIENKEKCHGLKVIPSPFYFEEPELDFSEYERYLKGKDYLLFFGRLQLHKGIGVLLKALPDFLKANPDAFVAIVGKDMPSSEGKSMKAFIQSEYPDYNNRLIFIDELRHKHLYPIILSAKLIVLPSLIDNLPNTLLESMAFGKVVVGSIGASFDEIIEDNRTGFLVKKGDSNLLASKLSFAWQNSDLDKIGKAAKQKIKEYAPDKTIGQLESYYDGILRKESMAADNY